MKSMELILCLLLLSYMLFADGTPAEGNGTYEYPYLIESLDNLLWLSTNQSLWEATSYFLQTDNIDASDTQSWNDGAGFSPIGIDWAFHGDYDGGDRVITNLYINRPDSYHVGLFGFAYEAEISNLGLINVNVAGDSLVAGLVGKNKESEINNCYVTGTVTGRESTGGIAGWNLTSDLNDCYSECDVSGWFGTGGLIGRSTYYSAVNRCFACGMVDGNWHTGGLSGVLHLTEVDNCYTISEITGDTYTGGFVGYASGGSELYACYFAGTVSGSSNTGGFAGVNSESQISYSVWNMETAGPSVGVGNDNDGVYLEFYGKTTAEMQDQDTYTDLTWDFVGESANGEDDIWYLLPEINQGYPYLYNVGNHLDDDEDEIAVLPFGLRNYPNPFNPETMIVFDLPEQGRADLCIYNPKGQLVKTLLQETRSAGQNAVSWDGRNNYGQSVSSGVYYLKLRYNEQTAGQKILLIK